MKHALIAAWLVLLGFTSSMAADRIRIGYTIARSAALTWVCGVAHDGGFFAKEGLEDQMILIPSGSQLAQMVVAGEVDIAALNGSSAMAAALQGTRLLKELYR